MKAIRDALADPFESSVIVLAGLALAGFAILGMTWRGVAAQPLVSRQVPYLVSGGFAGIALIGVSCGMVLLQVARRNEARQGAVLEEAIVAATALRDKVSEVKR